MIRQGLIFLKIDIENLFEYTYNVFQESINENIINDTLFYQLFPSKLCYNAMTIAKYYII